jgi:hypothetical protein
MKRNLITRITVSLKFIIITKSLILKTFEDERRQTFVPDTPQNQTRRGFYAAANQNNDEYDEEEEEEDDLGLGQEEEELDDYNEEALTRETRSLSIAQPVKRYKFGKKHKNICY